MAILLQFATTLTAILLAQSGVAATTRPMLPRQDVFPPPSRTFSSPATGNYSSKPLYDPHDQVPEGYSTIRVLHAVVMSVVVLFIFPLGGVLIRVLTNVQRLVLIHAIIQMIGFWIFIAGASLGIWMGIQIDRLTSYHPLLGMILLGFLLIQPATEILNHRFYQSHPKMIITAHVHLWLGRFLLVAGVVQGGLGFALAASFPNAVVDWWPRIIYTIVAIVVWILYIAVGIVYPECKGALRKRRKGKRTEAVQAGDMEELRVVRTPDTHGTGTAVVDGGVNVPYGQTTSTPKIY